MKHIYPQYNDSIVSLANSIMKYFDLKPYHSTLPDVDSILSTIKPKNVVVLLYDGMGTNILKNAIPSGYLMHNFKRSISSVLPPTTAASTTSLLSGLTPVEHGWLGWNQYIKPEDKVVTLFLNVLKDTKDQAAPYRITDKYLKYDTITDLINKNNGYSKIVSCYGNCPYDSLDEMNQQIIDLCNQDGKKYIYAYYENPDTILHHYGVGSIEALNTLKEIDEKTEELTKNLKDTVVIVTADHGHINCKDILLTDYPDFYATLAGDISIESRICSFRVKDKPNFIRLFNKYFKDDFILKTKEEVINEHLFGTGKEHPLFRDSLGDFLAIGITNKYFRYRDKSIKLISMHGGITEDEVNIPLIIIKK